MVGKEQISVVLKSVTLISVVLMTAGEMLTSAGYWLE